ncbi:MAG TPA: hypothetical protein VGL42_02450 [Opitutaceae bacterium]
MDAKTADRSFISAVIRAVPAPGRPTNLADPPFRTRRFLVQTLRLRACRSLRS